VISLGVRHRAPDPRRKCRTVRVHGGDGIIGRIGNEFGFENST
jgi:hypothetical protein